jgi:hypothetical protein
MWVPVSLLSQASGLMGTEYANILRCLPMNSGNRGHSDAYKSAYAILGFDGLPRLPPLLVDPLPRLAPLERVDELRCATPVHA